MPVFHTKTIESILEPVAQQISKLVVLQEDADDGNEMPDLSLPVQVVKKAADNLIKVGYETCEISDDLVLKNEMPSALKRVQEACDSLQHASQLLNIDPKSVNGKRSLISGERGILQGVSAILLTFDESEVRKIIQTCKQVLEYLSITELIEKIDDLVTYVKNFTPVITKMTKEIDARQKELTHQVHREILCENLDQVKSLTPSFISAIKIHLLKNGPANAPPNNTVKNSISENMNFLIKCLTNEVNEIIRILQLTSYDEDEWVSDNLTFIKQKFNSFQIKLKSALDWLSDANAVRSAMGEKSIRSAVEDARQIAKKQDSNEDVLTLCSAILSELDILNSDLNRPNDRNSQQMTSAAIVKGHLNALNEKLLQSVTKAQYVGLNKLSPTLYGKIEQALKWFNNPFIDDSGLGEQASFMIIEEARRLSSAQPPINDDQFFSTIYDCESLMNHFLDSIQRSKSQPDHDIKSVPFIGKQLQQKFTILANKITKALVQKVADDFLDINHPIRKLADVVMTFQVTPDLEGKFENCANSYIDHTKKLCETANQISLCSNSKNKRTVELISELTKRNVELAPRVVNAAFILLNYPGDKSCMENFELLKQQSQSNMERLQKLVDESIDCELFIKSCENSIIKETYDTQTAVLEKNNSTIITNALNIARRSNRIIQVATQEAENSEDADYVDRIIMSNEQLKQALPAMIQGAKLLAIEPNNKENYLIWANSNEKLIDAIAQVRDAVSIQEEHSSNRSSAQLSATNESNQLDVLDLNVLKIDEDQNNNYYEVNNHKPTPISKLPDLIEENEIEFPLPSPSQPILIAAHDLHVNVNQWSSFDNDMIAVAKRITLLMARLNELVRGENATKKDLIATARQLAEESLEISRIAKLIAADCTDKRMRQNLLQVSERIPTIGTQLKILSTVKATMLGSGVSKEEEEATEMLICNAQNLNASVKATVQAAKSASIRLKTESKLKLKWIRKKHNFTKIS